MQTFVFIYLLKTNSLITLINIVLKLNLNSQQLSP